MRELEGGMEREGEGVRETEAWRGRGEGGEVRRGEVGRCNGAR